MISNDRPLAARGDVAERLAAGDWRQDLLGPTSQWPHALRQQIEVLLNAAFPMFLVWGPARALIYNDAYRAILGDKHPGALGRGFWDVWPEVRAQIEPVIETAFAGQASFFENLQVDLDRGGTIEPAWFTFSYSPIPADDRIPGVLCVCVETTTFALERAARQESEDTLLFLDRLTRATSALASADAVMVQTTQLLGQQMGVSVCAYADMDEDEDGFTIRGDWAAPGARSIVGRYRLADFGRRAVENLSRGLPLVINDNRVEIAPHEAATFQAIGIGATICMPLVRDGRLRALMAVHHAGAHVWTDREQALVREVTERSWAFVERVGAEAEVRQAADELRSVTDAVPLLISYVDREQRYSFVNHAYETWFGRPRDQINGRLVAEVLGPAYGEVRPRLEEALAGARVSFESRMTYPDLGPRDIQVDYVPRRDARGGVIGVYVVVADITKRVDAERALVGSETRLRLATEFAEVGLWDVDEVGGELFWDDRVRAMFGVAPGAPVSMTTFYDGLHPDDLDATAAAYAAAADPVRRALYDVEYRTVGVEDGAVRWVAAKGRGLFDADGRCLRVVGTAIDITERQRLTRRLREESERVQLALDAGAIIGTWVWHIPTDTITADERFAQAFGLSPEACREGLPLSAAFGSIHPDDAPRVETAIAAALAGPGPYRCQYRVRQAQGYRWIEANGRVERGDDGAPLRFPGVLLDVEARRAIEAQRDQAIDLLSRFVEAAPGIVYAKDRAGRMTLANRGLFALLGREPAEVLGKTTAEIFGQSETDGLLMASDEEVMRSGQDDQREEFVATADGQITYWQSNKAPLRDEGGQITGLVSTSVDITARKHAEEARDLLMREVDHRARNSLAVIQSVVRLTDAADPAAFRQAIHGRIEAMARAQAALAKSQWRGGTIGEVVRDELLSSVTAASRVRLSGAEIPLPADHVQPLSMVLHELATNATKYGALSVREGVIDVRWASTSEGWSLDWQERGGPPAAPPSRTGFGSRLMNSLARQLNGKLEFDWGADGLSVTLTSGRPKP
jgi:PAS domain S-box-containing protein